MPEQKIEYRAFTIAYNGIANQLRSEATILYNGSEMKGNALWDTGATVSCISHDVVNSLGLIPTGKTSIVTPSGNATVDTFLLDIKLLNNVTVQDVVVLESEIGKQGLDLLIGMNIISVGDFAVSNYSGETVFTFRIPSKKRTDYVKQINAENTIGPKHGSGKRRKK